MSFLKSLLAAIVISASAAAMAAEPQSSGLLSGSAPATTSLSTTVATGMPVKPETGENWYRVAALCAGIAAVAATFYCAVAGMRKA